METPFNELVLLCDDVIVEHDRSRGLITILVSLKDRKFQKHVPTSEFFHHPDDIFRRLKYDITRLMEVPK